MGDEHIGTREEAIARFRAEQADHEKTRRVLEAEIARLRECLPTARERYAITRVADQWIPSHAREKDETPIRSWLNRLTNMSGVFSG